jgi:hypothetical protein
LELGLHLSRGFWRANNLRYDAHRDDGERFIVRSDEKLTAFTELKSAGCVSDKTLNRNQALPDLTALQCFLKTLHVTKDLNPG